MQIFLSTDDSSKQKTASQYVSKSDFLNQRGQLRKSENADEEREGEMVKGKSAMAQIR